MIGVSIGAKFITVFLSCRGQKISKKTSAGTAIGLSSSGGELALVVAKGGNDIGPTSSLVLPKVGTMTIVTTFIAPYVIKYGWKMADRLRDKTQQSTSSLIRMVEQSKSTTTLIAIPLLLTFFYYL